MNLRYRGFWKTRVSAAVLFLAAGLALPGWAGSDEPAASSTEYELKAAFLYHFAQFVEWPPEAFPDTSAPFVIVVAGNDRFREVLAHTVENKMIQGRKLSVRAWNKNQDGPRCQMLFISGASGAVKEILQETKGSGVLTIGDIEGFTQQGGMINFIIADDRVRFDINHRTAESARLRISSKLLALAKSVWE
jgi:hypothetical protein